MKLLTIKLKPLEPLMLRGAGEFDPSSRGVYTYASSLTLPRPGTFIGMLLSALIPVEKQVHKSCLNADGWESLFEGCYDKLLNDVGIEAVRGPFMIKSSTVYIPLMLGKKTFLVDYNQVRFFISRGQDMYGNVPEKYFKSLAGGGSANELFKLQAIMKLIESRIQKYAVEPRFSDRVGIHLRSRDNKESGKTTKEGYIYTAKYMAYPLDVDIAFVIALKEGASKFWELDGKAVRFGGEGRTVRLAVVDGISELGVVDNLLSAGASESEPFESEYFVLTSPAPLNYADYSRIKPAFIGRYAVMGFGFSLAEGRRKPLIPCLCEGSIVRVSKARKEKHDVLRYGLYSLLGGAEGLYNTAGRLGFASCLPLDALME